MRMLARASRRVTVVVTAALALAGCGADGITGADAGLSEIVVSATIAPAGVSLSPARLGAGPIELIASNQAATSQRIMLRSARVRDDGQPLLQRSGPINPGDTTSLKATLAEGTYVVSALSPAIAPATLAVGPARAADRDELLRP